MVADEEMTIDERRRYLKEMPPRYWAADRAGRGASLTEIAAIWAGLSKCDSPARARETARQFPQLGA